MCGICGFISRRNISLELLSKMNNTMIHRGPDDSGLEILHDNQGYNIGLAHRRLSIIDLSANGHQPMWSDDNRIVIVFNGEVYNFKDLKNELQDYCFRSDSDTEVIVAAYKKWGESCISRLQGMFAIAIYDLNLSKVILARDHIGEKPLYYWKKKDEVYFASELKPLMQLPWFEKAINKEVLARYLFQLNINAPESIFKNVYKLEPGTILEVSIEESIGVKQKRFWGVSEAFEKAKKERIHSFEDAKNGLQNKIRESVRRRLVSDVPIGCLLSGGVDSSLIAAVAKEMSEGQLRTFTIGFDEKEYDEAIYSKEVARHLGTNHTELYITRDEMLEQVRSISEYYDEPFSDSSQIPSMLVSKLVKNNCTVCLTGDGGDELFGGYTVYDRVKMAQRLDKLGGLAYAVGMFPIPGGKLIDRYPMQVRKIAGNRDIETKTQMNPDIVMNNAYRMIKLDSGYTALNCQFPFESRYNTEDWVEKLMLLHLDTLLPGDMLCKVDRASMKYSIEMRPPLLDINVIEYALRLPNEFKYGAGKKKYILKELTYDYIPKELLDRPKRGFSIPLVKWMKGNLKEEISTYANEEFLSKQGIFEPDFTNKFINDYLSDNLDKNSIDANNDRLVWGFFVFQQWYARFMG